MPLKGWLWQSYLRSAIIPLLVIELGFLAIFWIGSTVVYQRNIEAVSAISQRYLTATARLQGEAIGIDLLSTAARTTFIARRTLAALNGPPVASTSERQRYEIGAQGRGLRTVRDNGTTASFYSNRTRIGPAQLDKVWRLAALDPVLIDIAKTNPNIDSVYVNTADSYNRIYPYFDVASRYPPDMDIPTFNFFYEADAAHNPARQAVWTDAYIDPAGHGWMISSIAPVWRNNRLEAVVGVDITLKKIVAKIQALDLPWDGFAVLVDRNGRMIAMPPKAEAAFGLRELTDHDYDKPIQSDTLKPAAFDTNLRPDTRELAKAMRAAPSGTAAMQLQGGRYRASYSTIDGPGWRLVVVAPETAIFADATRLRLQQQETALAMVIGLLAFYVLFFWVLYRRAQAMSEKVAAPVSETARLLQAIGAGQYRQAFAGSPVSELDALGHELVRTGERLGDAHEQIARQEHDLRQALERQTLANQELLRFIRVMSHEVRTPLAIIDSGAQIIDRKAETLAPADLRDRAVRLRGAVRRITDVLAKVIASITPPDTTEAAQPEAPADVGALVARISQGKIAEQRLVLALPDAPVLATGLSSWSIVIRALVDNAAHYSPQGSTIRVALEADGDAARLSIEDEGPGMTPDELNRIGERFFRGSAATTLPGAGISLHISRNIVTEFGGNLEFSCKAGGTCAILTIPLDHQGGEA